MFWSQVLPATLRNPTTPVCSCFVVEGTRGPFEPMRLHEDALDLGILFSLIDMLTRIQNTDLDTPTPKQATTLTIRAYYLMLRRKSAMPFKTCLGGKKISVYASQKAACIKERLPDEQASKGLTATCLHV
eukprot:1141771-Pelagomonas_calceolata.AAC.1